VQSVEKPRTTRRERLVHEVTVETRRRTELVDVTQAVRERVRGESGATVTVFVPHTTAGLLVQARGEGAEGVAQDVETAFELLVDESRAWRHSDEGDRNPWAHVRAALTAASITIPLDGDDLALGDLQAIFLCEFDGPRRRRVLVTVA
jgi:secondary thiamine-phosphate synthase enzyme